MKASPFLLYLLLATCHGAFAQQPERQVLAASGNAQTVNGVTLCWTLGEVATATLSDGTITLTQGFQQPDSHGTTPAVEVPIADLSVKVYPNPAQNALIIELPEFPALPLKTVLTDVAGRNIGEKDLTERTTTFDLHDLPAAIYFLYLTDGKTQVKTVQVFKK